MRLCDPQTFTALGALLARYGLTLLPVEPGTVIPGSYWGESEAGLIGTNVFVRADAPLHSALHEAAHAICMDPLRRAQLHTDAGGDFAEEDAVCYLQIILARELGIAERDLCADMDAWGYTFRLGSAQAWFDQDAEEARQWLVRHELITGEGRPTWKCRGAAS